MGRKASPIPLPAACTSTQAVLLSAQVISRSTCDTRRQRRAGGWAGGAMVKEKSDWRRERFLGGFKRPEFQRSQHAKMVDIISRNSISSSSSRTPLPDKKAVL